MKYYKLKKDLPTFKKGELFYLDGPGSIIRVKDDLMAYNHTTVAKFPNILKDWFEPASEPERDKMTKWKFFEYLQFHKDERFFQAVRNFTRLELRDDITHIEASRPNPHISERMLCEDTFYWECDEMLKKDDDLSDEEQRANEY